MDAHEVHHSVVGAGVHDQPPVVADPHGQITIPLRELLGEGVLPDLAVWDQEPEGALARSEGFNIGPGDYFSCDGLVSCSAWASVLLNGSKNTYADSVCAQH